ncbi:MAG: LD-carboxypeptidase [Deltaproteobacteria bacterium]|nr:LD-carboxypeptidase [Deltaproteobacteria bacterium]
MQLLIRPPALRPGDTVSIVAPASHLPHKKRELLDAGIRRLESHGLRVIYDRAILDEHLYLAGRDEVRARVLLDAFRNPEVRAIIGTRGGYGSQRILPLLDEDLIRAHPKIFIGSSDLTAILIFMRTRCSLVTFYGPMVASKQFNGENARALLDTVQGLKTPVLTGEPLKPGHARGSLVGGCLTGLVHSLGTPYEVNLDGAILLAEDVNEAPYRIDRMLTHLRNAGKLQGIRGAVFGHMPGCDLEGAQEGLLRRVILDAFKTTDIPILFGVSAGHGPLNITIPLGVDAALDCTAGRLELDEPGVS